MRLGTIDGWAIRSRATGSSLSAVRLAPSHTV